MSKRDIRDLIEDIHGVLAGLGGWDAACTKFLSEGIAGIAAERFTPSETERTGIGMSSLGSPCGRKLWYKVHRRTEAGTVDPEMIGTFFYGDILEVLVLALAKAAGHEVVGMQDTLEINGIKGHRDAVIDGMTVDVKSASSFSFNKFKNGRLKDNDSFGYISQLSSYVYAGKDDPLVTNKTQGAFLVVSKERFNLFLDIHDFEEELKTKEQEVEDVKKMLEGPMPPRSFEEEDDGYYKGRGPGKEFKKNGNKVLGNMCGYCEYKKICWPSLRAFVYSEGTPQQKIKYFTKIKKEPAVPELKEF